MKIKVYCIIITSFLALSSLVAQDSHYWYKQYGTEGELLGGSVIGGITDLSSTFYNPGAIALTTDTSLIEGVNVLEFIWINAKDGAGKGKDLNSLFVQASPGILALRLPFEAFGENEIAVSYVIRSDLDYQTCAVRSDPYVDNDPDKVYESGEISNQTRLMEIWPGITWARKLSDHVGFGATMYIPIRSQRSRFQTLSQAVGSAVPITSNIIYDYYSYYNVRLLFKFGIAIDLEPYSIGFSLTTPSINLFGNGEVSQNIGLEDFQSDNLNLYSSFLASNYQEDLSTYYYSPLSIGAGATAVFGNTAYFFSAEWFDNVPTFNVMNPEDYKAQSSGDTQSYEMSHQLKSVFNFGVGIKHQFSKSFSLSGGLTTDRTADDPEKFSKFNVSTWDIIHLTLGGGFRFGKINFTFGVGYGGSSDIFLRLFKLKDNVEDVGNIDFHQLKFIFGLLYKL